MPAAHAALAWLAALTTILLLLLAVATASGRTSSYRLLDRGLLVQLAVSSLTALVGLAGAAAVAPPRDPLHLLYGGLAAGAPLTARAVAGATSPGRPSPAAVGRWVAAGALVALGSTVRSFMTGS